MLKAAFNIAAIGATLGTAFNVVLHGGTYLQGLESVWRLVAGGLAAMLTVGGGTLNSTVGEGPIP